MACEESQAVTMAFRAVGIEAYSSDLQPCSGGHPEWHIQGDVVSVIRHRFPWDIIILHPPCTALAVSGNRWYGVGMIRDGKRQRAKHWTYNLWEMAKEHSSVGCALENPVGVLSKIPGFGKPQYIQPWQFGHGETKKTGLWLHGLPPLKPTNIVDGREHRIWKMGPSPDRAKARSKTFPGIAAAMAEQWGKET